MSGLAAERSFVRGTIGDNTVIGAGSVVTKSMPANVIAYGNPCRVQRRIDPDQKPDEFNRIKREIPVWRWRPKAEFLFLIDCNESKPGSELLGQLKAVRSKRR